MNCCRETVEVAVIPGNRRELDSVLERYVAGFDTQGRQEGRSDTWSQQATGKISGLGIFLYLFHLSQSSQRHRGVLSTKIRNMRPEARNKYKD
jgi:hypothetical protein